MSKNTSFHSVHEISMDLFAERVYEHLREFSADRVSVREEERRTIAREIHDELGQILVALKIDVSTINRDLLKKEMNFSRAKVSCEIERIEAKIDNAIETVHRVISELRSETLTRLGLRGAIEWQAREFQARTGIEVEIRSIPETVMVTDPNCATAVLRIFQEALMNVGRHAMASRVETTIQENKEFLMMQIKDNGRGINESDLRKTSSFGLLGLKERVFLFQGNVEIKGVPDQGTTVTVRIPLKLCNSQFKRSLSEESR